MKILTKLACTPLITKTTSNFELTSLNYTHFELTFNNIETHFSVLLEYEVEVDFNVVNSSSSLFCGPFNIESNYEEVRNKVRHGLK